MPRVRPAVAAAVVLVAVAAVAGLVAAGAVSAPVQPGDAPVAGASENTSRVLLLTEADAAAADSASPTVTESLAAGHAALSTEFRLERTRQRLDAVDARDAQREVLETEIGWAADRVTALLEREQAAREAFVAGDIDAETYLVAVGRIHAEARSLEQFLGEPATTGTLYSLASPHEGLRPQISRARARLQSVVGPVRERVAGVVTGDRDRVRVHVTVGNGVMLSTIDGGQYVRETYRPDNVDSETSADYGDPISFVEETYPWTANNSRAPSYSLLGNYAVFFTTNHDHGELAMYADVTTNRVYVERQWKTLSGLPATFETTSAANNTTLLVSRTYAGGPVKLRVENASGEPLDAAIRIDGDTVGETGFDGELWVLSPAGEYSVAATADGVTLTANVTAPPAPPTEPDPEAATAGGQTGG
jgi:hypothetical protein